LVRCRFLNLQPVRHPCLHPLHEKTRRPSESCRLRISRPFRAHQGVGFSICSSSVDSAPHIFVMLQFVSNGSGSFLSECQEIVSRLSLPASSPAPCLAVTMHTGSIPCTPACSAGP